jgi:hypothetical protein
MRTLALNAEITPTQFLKLSFLLSFKNSQHGDKQQAPGVKIYAQGKTRTRIITRAQPKTTPKRKRVNPTAPKTPTREK